MGSSSDPNHRFLCLTGVVFELGYIKTTVNPDIENLKTKYFDSHPDEPVIFHRKEMVNKKHPFKALLSSQTETNFNDEFLALLRKWQFVTITVLIDKLAHQNLYKIWRYDPYHYCLAIMLERYHLKLKELNVMGDMMVEARGGKEDIRLKESYKEIFTRGTDWIKPEEIDDTITSKELKIKPKSANISGLQVADLLAYPLCRFALSFYDLKSDKRPTFNEEIIEIIRPKIYNNDGSIDGYGLKLLP